MKDHDNNALFAEPRKVSIVGYNVVRFEITLPNGVLLKLTPGQSYITSDAEELEFLSMQKGISITPINDAEYRRHFTKLVSELPTVFNKEMSHDETKAFFWNTGEEKAVVEELRKRGYTINDPIVETESAYISTKEDNGDDIEAVKKISPVKSVPPKKRSPKKK